MISFILMIFLYIFLFLLALGILGMLATSIENNGFVKTLGNLIANIIVFALALGGVYLIIEGIIS